MPNPFLIPTDPQPRQERVNPFLIAATAPESSMSEAGRFAATALIRGIGSAADFIADPLSPIRRLIDPRIEAIEQSGRPRLGQKTADLAFSSTGLPEYQPATERQRLGLALAEGAVAGAPFGVGGALLGAASGASGQATMNATGNERAATAAALAPALIAGGVRSSANAMRERYNPAVNRLMEIGVRPTPGQIIGGSVGRAEEGLTSIPFVGDIIKSGRARAGTQLNRGVINEALKPIGERLDKSTPIGRDAVAEMIDKQSQAYQSAVPEAGASLTPRSISELANLRENVQLLPKAHARAFDNTLKTYLIDQLGRDGYLSGEAFKSAEEAFGKEARAFRNSGMPFDRKLGDAYLEAQRILRASLAEASPDKASEIAAANKSYAMGLRVTDAASRSGGKEPGEFSPAQLQASVKKYANNPREYAAGRSLMQDISDPARQVLGSRLPDSGTPYRGLLTLGTGMALGGGVPVSHVALAAALGLPAWALYSPLGQAAISRALAGSPSTAGVPPGLPSIMGGSAASRSVRQR